MMVSSKELYTQDNDKSIAEPDFHIKPMIKPSLLEIPNYKIEFVFGTNDKSYNNLDTMEIRPVELDSSILFYNHKSKEGPLLPVSTISDVKIVSENKGILRKKQERIVEISFDNKNNEKKIIKIVINDGQIDEFLNYLRIIQNNLLNDSLKITKTLIFKITPGKSNSIKISPMSPFLFQNEEIVWKNIITTKSIKNKDKIKLLDIITTYRVFQYDYTNHKGKFILMNEIKDTKINDLKKISDFKIDENYNINNPPNNIKTDFNSNSDEIGDIEIISTSKLAICFANIRNPIKIKDLLEITRKQCNFSTDGGTDEIKIQHIKDDVKELKNDGNNIPIDIEEIICDTCNKKNSLTYKYCIKCGQKLQKIIICKKCDQSNVIDAVFCNMCGNKL